jgi:hypothetical protein
MLSLIDLRLSANGFAMVGLEWEVSVSGTCDHAVVPCKKMTAKRKRRDLKDGMGQK